METDGQIFFPILKAVSEQTLNKCESLDSGPIHSTMKNTLITHSNSIDLMLIPKCEHAQEQNLNIIRVTVFQLVRLSQNQNLSRHNAEIFL